MIGPDNCDQLADTDSNRKLVVVLGMHRSGTSLITRGLESIGLITGDNLIQAIPGVNEKGFFEDVDFVELNEELLAECGKDWHSLEPIEESDVDDLLEKGYLKRAADLLQVKRSLYPRFVFKDPRTTRLLAFWSKVFESEGLDVHYIMAIRNPLSVAKSLLARDGFSPLFSYYLWIGYILSGLEYAQKRPAFIVDYDRVIEDPFTEFKAIAGWLRMPFDSNAVNDYAHNFICSSLRHSIASLAELLSDEVAPQLCKDIYSHLTKSLGGHDAQSPATDSSCYKDWTEQQHLIAPLLRLVDQQYNTIQESKAANKEAQVKAEHAMAHAMAEAEHARAETEHARAETEHANMMRIQIENSHLWKALLPARRLLDAIKSLS